MEVVPLCSSRPPDCAFLFSYGNGGAEQIIGRFTAAEKPSKVLSPHILARYCIPSMHCAMGTSTLSKLSKSLTVHGYWCTMTERHS